MKEIAEIRAEVFRRSDEKIRRRRQTQKKLLAIGVPALAVAFVGGMVLAFKPAPFPEQESAMTKPNYTETVSSEPGMSAFDFTESLFKSDPLNDVDSDEGDITDAIVDSSDAEAAEKAESPGMIDQAEAIPEATQEPYLFTLTDSDGVEHTYTLLGNTLTREDGTKKELSDRELEELKAALGID